MPMPLTQDPLETVTGVRGRYHCPDLASVDRHLRLLTLGLHSAGLGAPKLVAEYRSDIDLLLGRRAYLTAITDQC